MLRPCSSVAAAGSELPRLGKIRFFFNFFFTFRRCQLGLDAGNAALLRQPRSCHAGNADESINLPEPRAASHVCEVNGIKPNKTGAWRKG